ncbi:MAG: acylphosphatase [Pirellulales bacterium]
MSKREQRMEVLFSGHVQGVGFRYTACSIAHGIGVTGFVENLSDGRVGLTVEGPGEAVDRCVAEILDRMQGLVRHTETTTSEGTGEFCDFRVRYG